MNVDTSSLPFCTLILDFPNIESKNYSLVLLRRIWASEIPFFVRSPKLGERVIPHVAAAQPQKPISVPKLNLPFDRT